MLFRSFISFGEAFGVSVVIVGDTLKFFHGSYTLLNKINSLLLKSLHVLVLDSILLHLLGFSILSNELSHMLIYYKNFVDGSSS